MSTDTTAARAKALLERAKAARAKPCVVGASEHRELIEAMSEQGGSPPLIWNIARDELKWEVGRTSIASHLARECRCYRGDPYRSIGPEAT